MKVSRPPTIPRCCAAHRLGALDLLDALIANDVIATFDRLLEDDWSADQAGTALRLYREWMLGRVAGAIDFGLELLDLEVAA